MTTENGPGATLQEFRDLHDAGCFVIPNPWDVGSAVLLRSLGFRALATTSAGYAFTRGRPDGVDGVPLDAMLGHIREIVTATPLPVSADFQSGYASSPEGVAENVRLLLGTGVAGLSIEDATGDAAAPLFDRDAAVERVRAARAAIDASGVPAVLTARCEAALVGHPDATRVAIERLVAFADAGADCLFAPGVSGTDEITAIVRAVAPRPVNFLASTRPDLSVGRLAELGVRRISVGSALARTAWEAVSRTARGIADEGSFEGLRDAAPMSGLNALFDA